MTLTIRARLASWYAGVLALVLACTATGFYLLYSRARLAGIDQDLARAGALVARLVPPELEEGRDLPEAAHDALEDVAMAGRSLAVLDGAGVVLSGTWDALPATAAGALAAGTRTTATLETPSGGFRVFREGYRHHDTVYQVGVAESIEPYRRELAHLRQSLFASALLALALAGSGGFWIARGALRPVERMADQARLIDDRTPGRRLSAPNPADELGRLAAAFNDLVDRLESALAQERRFMADASHELRTPVSIARTAIEVTLGRSGRAEDEYRESLSIVAEQVRRLARIVEDMFTLARADGAGLPLDRRPLYLDELVAEGVKEARMLALPRGVEIEAELPSDLEGSGDEGQLRRMLLNLLDNAIRHTPAGSHVRVTLTARPQAAEIAVTDRGAGIAEADRERIFERFVRLEAPHRPGEGAGLGLPIARAIAEAHGGTLALARSDASGSTFLVTLPRPEAS